MTFNNSQKLLAGVLALVLVAGMTSPAFAGIPPQCEITEGDNLSVQLSQDEQTSFQKTIECNDSITGTSINLSECIAIGIDVEFGEFNPQVGTISTTEILTNVGLGDNEGHCILFWSIFLQSGSTFELEQELWFNVPEQSQVAGETLPTDNTALVLAGLQSMTPFMIPAVAGITGAGIYLAKFRARD